MSHQRRVALFTLTVAAVIAACSKAPPPAPAPTPTPAPAAPNQDSINMERARRLHDDSVAQAESARRRRQQEIDDSIAREIGRAHV